MASELFEGIVCDNHSPSITCEFCGRVHFGVDEDDYDELSAKQDKEPNKYVGYHDANRIAWGHIDGKVFVWGCECGGADRYEKWIWNNRKLILEYLKHRTQAAVVEAEQEAEFVQECIEAKQLRRIVTGATK